MITGCDPAQIRRRVNRQPNVRPLARPREALSPEATSRLAQQIATILQRLRDEGPGRADQQRRRD
jgi:hypothetical protein